jgi:hypothetical protein
MKQMSFTDSEVRLNMGLDSDLNLNSYAKLFTNTKVNSKVNFQSAASSNLNDESDFNSKVWQKNIHHLKDAELESQLKLLVGRERQLLHLILKHIQEVDRRKLYAARAFSSLFEYLTKAMGYSFAAAQRRIEAARMMNQVPELALQIQKGDVNLSQIGVISQAVKFKESQTGKKISAEIKREVIAKVAKKTTAQTQVLVAEKLDLPLQQPERKTLQKDQSCILSITFTPEQQIKLQRCRELLAAKMQQGRKSHSTVNYLEELMDFYLSKKDPCLERNKPCESSDKPRDRSNRVSKKNQSTKISTWVSESVPFGSHTSEKETEKNRAISLNETVEDHAISLQEIRKPKSTSDAENTNQKSKGRQPSLKRQIFQKWKDCQFHDPLTGRKCGEKFQLEIEHLQPRWAGGKDCLENRTLLCRTHNQWKYRQQVGLH